MSKNSSSNGCLILVLFLAAVCFVGIFLQIAKITIILVLLIIAICLTYLAGQYVYYLFKPEEKKAKLEIKRKEAEELQQKKEFEEKEIEETNAQEEKRIRDRRIRETKRLDEIRIRETKRLDKIRIREEEERKKAEHERQTHRDGDRQESPYTYQIGRHGNESLAIRYGIANQQRKVKEYWYHAKGGEKRRSPDRDKEYFEPATTIQLQKTQKLVGDMYEVLLIDYRSRKAKVIIEPGTEYVKTFYPYTENWFDKHSELEQTLKGNGTFNLKELATFHVQKTVDK